MADINAGRFNRFIQKLFYIQSGGPATLHGVDSAVQTVLSIQDGVETRYLQGWNRFAITSLITGAAAANGAIEIRNPTGSAVVAVLERVSFIPTGPATSDRGVLTYTATGAGSDLTTQVFGVRLDGRIQPGSSMILSTSTNAVGFSSIINAGNLAQVETNYILNPNQEIPILPGGAAILIQVTVANSAVYNLMWRERVMEQSELT